MIRSIEAFRYRSLYSVSAELGDFQLLVGPNASGKSTFLDVVDLLGDLLRRGLEAVHDRAADLRDLTWMREEPYRVELAVELEIPEALRPAAGDAPRVRYEVALGYEEEVLTILQENLWLTGAGGRKLHSFSLSGFPARRDIGRPVVRPGGSRSPQGWRKLVSKNPGGNDYFQSETTKWRSTFRLGGRKLALANLPEDEERFPVSIWAKRVLMEGTHLLRLDGERMRLPSPRGTAGFQADGSNLPWVLERLRNDKPERFDRWLDHVRTALPAIRDVETVERPEDRRRYLRILYRNGLQAPSWTVSDGTLRLLALTLLAYLDEPDRIFLVEEPENGIHPQAVEAVFQSLTSAYGSQILCATHSPTLLSLAEPGQVLCFGLSPEGATDVISGYNHPRLKNWQREVDLGTLFATGVLG